MSIPKFKRKTQNWQLWISERWLINTKILVKRSNLSTFSSQNGKKKFLKKISMKIPTGMHKKSLNWWRNLICPGSRSTSGTGTTRGSSTSTRSRATTPCRLSSPSSSHSQLPMTVTEKWLTLTIPPTVRPPTDRWQTTIPDPIRSTRVTPDWHPKAWSTCPLEEIEQDLIPFPSCVFYQAPSYLYNLLVCSLYRF